MATKKKSTTKKASRKYSPRAGEKVAEEMREMKRGKLRSGRSKKKVTSRKQAIAIGLSEARREGAQVPPAPKRAQRAKPKVKTSKRNATKAPGSRARKSTSKATNKSRRKTTHRSR